jgi:hypothetical protein
MVMAMHGLGEALRPKELARFGNCLGFSTTISHPDTEPFAMRTKLGEVFEVPLGNGTKAAFQPGLCSRVSERRGVGFDLAEDGVHPGAFFAG